MVLRDTANTGGFLLGLLRLVEGISAMSSTVAFQVTVHGQEADISFAETAV